MNSQTFQQQVNTLCDLLGGEVLDAAPALSLFAVADGRVEYTETASAVATVRLPDTIEEGPTQELAGRHGLALARFGNEWTLTPA
jgi:hypothetical protein